MGKGNYVNPEGFQFYINYPDNNEESEMMFYDIKETISYALRDKGFFSIDEWCGNDLKYFLEGDYMKIGLADDDTKLAICFSPRVTSKYRYDKRSINLIKTVISALLKQEYDITGRCSAWTSRYINTPEEAIEKFCDFETECAY